MKELEKTLLEKQINPTAMRLVVLDYLIKQTNAVSLTDMELSLEKTDRVLYTAVSKLLKNMALFTGSTMEPGSQICTLPARLYH
jgi:Fe2+ or Zn2+ uptake regulation protein